MNTDMIGHNKPPTDHELIRENMAEKNAKAIKRAKALVEAADRVPEKIDDQDTADKITDLEKQITFCFNALEAARKEEKAPYWEMCKVVDGFFSEGFLDPLTAAKKRVKKIQTAFLVEQENIERSRRAELAKREQEERDRKANEAAKLEAEGKKSQAEAILETAIQHDHDAAFFEGAAQARGATVAASQGEMTGAKSSLRYIPTGEIVDREVLDLEALRPYLSNDALQKALNAFVKMHGVNRQIKGAKIWEKPEATTR